MKIAFTADSFLLDKSTGINGTQVQMYNLAVAFGKRNQNIHYIALTSDKTKINEMIDGINIHWIQEKKFFFSWIKEIKVYFNILDHIQPDVIYQRGRSHLTFLAGKWAKKNNKKFIWGSNGENSCDFWKRIKSQAKSQRPFWKKVLLYPLNYIQDVLIHYGIKNADQVINQTEYQKQRLLDNYKKNGTVLPSFFLPTYKRDEIPKQKIVLWLANLNRNKQPEIFINLAKECEDSSDWLFILAGGSSNLQYIKEIEYQANKLNNLKLIGAIPFEQSNDYYAMASLFINTSQVEADGLPNSFIQAWINGTPVLSLNHDPNGWLMKHNIGKCSKGNIEHFFYLGKELLGNDTLLKQMGDNSKSFSYIFSSNKTIDSYLQIFSK